VSCDILKRTIYSVGWYVTLKGSGYIPLFYLFMKNIMKIKFNILFVIMALALFAEPSSASQISEKTALTPCQYGGAYEYYKQRGDKYLEGGNYESAIESYERALIIRCNSKETRAKLVMAKEALSGRKTTMKSVGRSKAMQSAVSQAEYRHAVSDDASAAGTRIRPIKEPEVYKTGRASTPVVQEKQLSQQELKIRHVVAKKDTKDTQIYSIPSKRPEAQERSRPVVYAKKDTIQYKKDPVPSVSKTPETQPVVRVRTPEPKFPSSMPAEKSYKPAVYQGNDFECQIPVFQNFSDGVNSKIQEGTKNINSNIGPSTMSGEYRIAFGATSNDFIWKDANADYHNMPGVASWRYLFGEDRHNTYDKAIYSRLKVDLDAHFTDTISGFGQMVIDPWTFVGKKRVDVISSSGDSLKLDYKYWSGSRSTINETYRTARGDIVNINENKVVEGKTSPASYSGLDDWGPSVFDIDQKYEIDRMYVPIRKLWVEYNQDPYKVKAFAMAGQEEALTSSDPMRLSNNKVWWEESPWLDRYDASRVFSRAGNPVKKGQWASDLSYMARDSDDQRLTFLRGASFDAGFSNGTTVKGVIASPRNLWDTYDQASSIPAALEIRTPVTDKFTLGGLYTFKGGLHKKSLEAMNNVGAIDGSYQIFDNTEVFGQLAASNMRVKEANDYSNSYTGYAGSFGIKSEGPISFTNSQRDNYQIRAMFASMNDKFFPGLSDYGLTRKEFEHAKHIYFDDIKPENESCMIGDGMDVGRNAFNLSAKAEFPDSNIDTRLDFRTVYNSSNKHIEDVYRLEGTYKPINNLTLKGLAFYKRLPKTEAGIDPLINAKSYYSSFTSYFTYEDVWLRNPAIEAGKDPSIGAFSAGLKYDFTDYFTGEGIYQSTNDPKDNPRGILNTEWVEDFTQDGILWDKIVPSLYRQESFGVPPYNYYNIFKTRFMYQPFDPLKITLKYTYNENKYAMTIDDNATSQGIEVEYKPCPRTTIGFLYQYTRQRDLYKEIVANEGYNFDGHHNIFTAFDYKINQDQHLRIMYGAYVGYDYNYAEERDDINALDTRHIVRFAYTGKFGPSEKGETALTSSKPNALGPLNPAIPGATFYTKLSGGWAKYTEMADVAPVESSWDNYLLRLDLGLDAYDREYWEGGIRLGLFTTFKDQEKWDHEGIGTYQTNDMSFSGADVNADIGWAIANSSKYISVTPLIHVGYRRIEFKRNKISTTSTTVSGLGEASENFNVSYAGVGGRIDMGPANNMNFYTSGYWAPLVYAPINNSRLGRVTCTKGNIWHAEGGVDYAISDRFDLNLGGFWDRQHLKKAERIDDGIVNFEMPDNKLDTFGVTLGGQYRF
jgi:hypothetical protein